MAQRSYFGLKKLGFFCLLVALSLSTLRAAEGESLLTLNVQPEAASSNDVARAYLQLQDQIFATQFAVERARLEFQKAATQDAITVSNRMQAMQDSLLLQHSELAEAHHMNRLLLMLMAALGAVVFAAAGMTVFFQSRAMNRIATVSAQLSANRAMAMSLPPPGSTELLTRKALGVEQSNARLMGLVQVLEKRIGELEQTAGTRVNPDRDSIINGHTQKHAELTLDATKDSIAPTDASATGATAPKELVVSTTTATESAESKDLDMPNEAAPAATDSTTPKDGVTERQPVNTPTSRVTAGWMERAQSFMADNRPEDAMAYFDAILVTEPKNAEALRKKGMALEKLSRPQEALEYYNRAIAADGGMTQVA